MGKASKREFNREYKNIKIRISELIKGNKSLKDLVLFLSIQLYIKDPADEIFSNGSFVEKFMEDVKAGAKKKLEQLKGEKQQ